MKLNTLNRFLFHSPRLLAILFAIILVLFAADVFNDVVMSLGEKMLSFGVKLLTPTIIIAALVFAWKREMIGGLIFIVLGIAFFLFGWNNIALWKLLISGSVLIFIGVLFLLNQRNNSKKDYADIIPDN